MTRLGLLNFGMRRIGRPFMSFTKTPEQAERDFERVSRLMFRRPPGTKFTTSQVILDAPTRQMPMARITAGPVDDAGAILFLHGGGYIAGSAFAHRGMLARLSRIAKAPVFAPNYRLAQYAPFPAAFDDALAAWTHLRRDQNLRPEQIVLAGDSAGGGLALALMAHLLNDGQRPAGLIGLSSWTDLTLTGPSLKTNEKSDAILIAARMPELCDIVLAGADPADPRISPLFATWTNPPPVYLQASKTEILLDDTVRMADALKAAGAEVTVDLWPDAPHVWQIFDGWLPEARDALQKAGAFAKVQLSRLSQGES